MAVPRDGEFLVRTIYLSLDPTNRFWMNLPSVPLGGVMRGFAIGMVEESHHSAFQKGDLVQGLMSWETYTISDGAGISRVPSLPIPLTAHFGLLGHIGLAAYFGLLDIGKPKVGETLVVSAAAGAVGSLAGQIGRIKGCLVVGIAGGPEKCAWIKEELGFDAAIDYRKEDVLESLREHCPNGIDIYFDNVGGPILNAALALINEYARIPLCGMISGYNATRPGPGPSNLPLLFLRRGLMQGFIFFDYLPKIGQGVQDLMSWYSEGRIKYKVDIVEGLENAPGAFLTLFTGGNTGKLLVKVSPEP